MTVQDFNLETTPKWRDWTEELMGLGLKVGDDIAEALAERVREQCPVFAEQIETKALLSFCRRKASQAARSMRDDSGLRRAGVFHGGEGGKQLLFRFVEEMTPQELTACMLANARDAAANAQTVLDYAEAGAHHNIEHLLPPAFIADCRRLVRRAKSLMEAAGDD